MAGMLNVGVREAQRSFFDRPGVMRAMSRQKRRVFSKFGAFVRTRARSSIRAARQKSLGEMTDDEITVYRIRQAKAKKSGGKRPKRPLASAAPGEPPRSVIGWLKSYLFFAYDSGRDAVVIGPALFNGAGGTAPRTLEEGGDVQLANGRRAHVRPHPYMKPAFDHELNGLGGMWASAANEFGK